MNVGAQSSQETGNLPVFARHFESRRDLQVLPGRRVVDGVSVSVQTGEVVGLLGPNGGRQTTSFYMIVGLITPDAGRVFHEDRDITNLAMYERARVGISYLPQEASVFRKLSVEDNLMAILETLSLNARQRRERLEMLLEQMGLEKVRKNKGYMLGRRTAQGGDRAFPGDPAPVFAAR